MRPYSQHLKEAQQEARQAFAKMAAFTLFGKWFTNVKKWAQSHSPA